MPKSPAEYVSDFLLELLPGLLPKPSDDVAKALVGTFKSQLDNLLSQPRIRRELLDAAREAESHFRSEARKQMKSDELVQAVASFPLWGRDLFQSTLKRLPEHLEEDLIARDLSAHITDDWKGKFSPADLREGVAIYLNCLRVQLLKVEGFADIVTRLATLRTDVRTEQILRIVSELVELVKELTERVSLSPALATSLFTVTRPVNDFTGRTAELDSLKKALFGGAVIVGITGGGGIGKTQLARKLAQEVADNFPNARMEIDLHGVSESQTPIKTEDAIRRLLEPFYEGKKLPDDLNQLRGLYQDKFSSCKALLLLDNAANADQVKLLIPPAPSAAIVTSRQHFSLSEYDLHPLRLDLLTLEQARELLRSTTPKLKEAPDKDVEELATLCGRLPLALRVAAALLNDRDDWRLTTLRDRLASERTRLERLKRPEDLDVGATLNLSYKLLPPDLQKYFRCLSVFTAPFQAVWAAAIWGMGEDASDDVIGKLVNRSLLNFVDYGFYDLHDLTRLFTTQRLLENEVEAMEAVARHAQYFAELAIRSAEKSSWLFPTPRQARFRLVEGIRIQDHLFAAYATLLPEQQIFPRPQIADRWLSQFPQTLAIFERLPPRTKIPMLEQVIGAAQRLGDKENETKHLRMLGDAYAELGEIAKAISAMELLVKYERDIVHPGVEKDTQKLEELRKKLT